MSEEVPSQASCTKTNKHQLLESTRFQWLYERCSADVTTEEKLRRDVEANYRKIWEDGCDIGSSATAQEQEKEHEERPNRRKQAVAGERLALLLLQSGGNAFEADGILMKLGFTCRLGHHLFNYVKPKELLSMASRTSVKSDPAPCCMFDDVLTLNELQYMKEVFSDPSASYWTDNSYCVEPASPYVSYVIPLPTKDDASKTHFLANYGFIASIILRVQQHISLWKPLVVQQSTWCEMWAHNRPLVTGHQLHFDSDNEGCEGVIRHPLVTAILCLSDNGGPTLITNQRLVSRQAADRGWLAFPAINRLVLMDGRVLHCVIPGKRCTSPPSPESVSEPVYVNGDGPSNRRVTLMLAFWKRIRVRDEQSPGAARPFPIHSSTSETPRWAKSLTRPVLHSSSEQSASETRGCATPVTLVTVPHVYESLSDGQPWSRKMGMPAYEQVFQGI